jgi:hypothetical protein
MSLYEKTVYPRLTEPLTADELAIHFTPSEEEIEFTIKTARLPGSRLSLMVLLKLFQKLHRFPNTDEVPASVVEHLRIQLRFGAAVLFEYDDPFQRARQRNAIREYTGLQAWSKEARHVAAVAGYQAALVMGRAADVTNAIIGALTNALSRCTK